MNIECIGERIHFLSQRLLEQREATRLRYHSLSVQRVHSHGQKANVKAKVISRGDDSSENPIYW